MRITINSAQRRKSVFVLWFPHVVTVNPFENKNLRQSLLPLFCWWPFCLVFGVVAGVFLTVEGVITGFPVMAASSYR